MAAHSSDPFLDDELAPGQDHGAGHVDDLTEELNAALNTVDLDGPKSGAPPAAARVPPRPGPDIFPTLEEKKAGVPLGDRQFEVTVTDPETKGEGIYAYVIYKVNTKIGSRVGHVLRRYSDFAWLRGQLIDRQDGCLVPPLPEKAIVGRFDQEFLSSRRRALELFINRVVQHKELCKDPNVELFLFGGQDFLDAKAGKAPVDASGKPKRGFMDFVSEMAQSVSNTWGAGKEREKTEKDVACLGIEAKADELEEKMTVVHKSVQALTKKTNVMAKALFDFGFSFIQLGQYETEQDEQALGNAFVKLGNTADRLSVLLAQKVDVQLRNFEEPIADYLRIVEAVKQMLKARAAAVLTHQTSLSALESKQASLAKYQNKSGKEDKFNAAQAAVVEAQKKVDEDAKRLDEITERVFAETARFRNETRSSFKKIMIDFVRMQVEHARKIQTAWESILGDMEALPFDEAHA